MSESLLEELKEYLQITWDDENKRLHGFLNRGIAKLEDIAGVKLDFDKDEVNKELLFDYCRYARFNVSEHFEENFKSELVRLQLKSAIKDYEKNKV